MTTHLTPAARSNVMASIGFSVIELLLIGVAVQSVLASSAATTATSHGPLQAVAASANAQLYQDIDAGNAHTCAVTMSGGVRCWGSNSYGQLGDGTTTLRRSPIDVVGMSNGATAVAAGGTFSCALMNTGGVKCWGLGRYGALGAGSTITRSYVSVDVVGLSNVVAIQAGVEHACALTSTGGVKCWGSSYNGHLATVNNTPHAIRRWM
ncbi:MAG TPA: hypothetical protein VFF59_06170 [Anaerolineae bacterium]|nr:hypothetical protein [Anaerolineae bacterium]